ncbi:hypothetical protein BK742_19650 [Bacillus thuringiensis serovar pingluonsis]|uniref:Integrase catalytic domain-containing protein n=1 Tax=Bacillus thuringiensis serovar pingluonsis TaxID=180881 RepID=A0A243B7F3_BACTU|nr:hypothetical protein BK742_19650 [Bacillus thuringiensis serovar pingluonsis]
MPCYYEIRISVSKKIENVTNFKRKLAKCIEYYNHTRIKAILRGMDPVQYWAHTFEVS